MPLCLFLTPTTASLSWIAEDLVTALHDIPPTCAVDVGIYITGSQAEEDGSLDAVRTSPQSEPINPDIEKHPRVESGSLSIKSADTLGGLVKIPGVDVRFCRPDVKKILEAEINNADSDISVNGQLSRFRLQSIFLNLKLCSVTVCGGPGINSAVKEALSPVRFLEILKGAPNVSLHVETFGDAVRSAFP